MIQLHIHAVNPHASNLHSELHFGVCRDPNRELYLPSTFLCTYLHFRESGDLGHLLCFHATILRILSHQAKFEFPYLV